MFLNVNWLREVVSCVFLEPQLATCPSTGGLSHEAEALYLGEELQSGPSGPEPPQIKLCSSQAEEQLVFKSFRIVSVLNIF